jgi:hypothetical protein
MSNFYGGTRSSSRPLSALHFSGAIGVNVKGNADPELPREKLLAIGYGDTGATPFCWDTPKGVNVTFLKLYFTTVPMDFGWLEQESPFEPFSVRATKSLKKINEIITAQEANGATALLTVVQHPDPCPIGCDSSTKKMSGDQRPLTTDRSVQPTLPGPV